MWKMKALKKVLLPMAFTVALSAMVGVGAHAATSSEVAQALSEKLPIATYAAPLSGASKVYASRGSGYIDTYVDRIVITDYTWDGKEVYVTYPTSSGYLSRWFKTEDIIGITNVSVDKYNYTMSYRLETYRMNGKNSTTGAGWIGDGDDCVSLGSHEISGVNYYPTIYPDNAPSTINGIQNVKYHLRLAKEMMNDMKDVTKDFVGKSIMVKSDKNGKYLAAYGSNTNTPLLAITTTPSTDLNNSWEIFKVTGTDDGWCGFKAYNGKWLSTRLNQDDTQWSPVQAVADDLCCSWERFRIYQSAAGDYYIRAKANDRFLTSRSDPSYPIVARFDAEDSWNSWTKFKIEVVQDSLDQKISFNYSSSASSASTTSSSVNLTVNGTSITNGSTFYTYTSGGAKKGTGYSGGYRYVLVGGKYIDVGSGQCLAYARSIQQMLYGCNEYSSSGKFKTIASNTKLSASTAKKYITQAGVGAHIRTTNPHSLVVISIDSDGFYYTDANYDWNNTIRVGHFTWAGFANTKHSNLEYLKAYQG